MDLKEAIKVLEMTYFGDAEKSIRTVIEAAKTTLPKTKTVWAVRTHLKQAGSNGVVSYCEDRSIAEIIADRRRKEGCWCVEIRETEIEVPA